MLIIDNLELKSELLNGDSFNRYRRWRFAANKSIYNPGNSELYEKSVEAKIDICDLSVDDIKACRQLFDNNRQRALRLKNRIKKWSSRGSVYFVTLTFRDDVLSSTSAASRKQYVTRYFNARDSMFAANLDYGGKFEREHYHALICTEKPIEGKYSFHKSQKGIISCYLESSYLDEWKEKFGFATLQGPIFRDDTDSESAAKVSKYISKCSNHALKETAKSSRLIVGRIKYEWFYKK